MSYQQNALPFLIVNIPWGGIPQVISMYLILFNVVTIVCYFCFPSIPCYPHILYFLLIVPTPIFSQTVNSIPDIFLLQNLHNPTYVTYYLIHVVYNHCKEDRKIPENKGLLF